ncbi:unnamed protein product [Rhizoctonia solani]|uniref:Vegetative incompatibility protein HET-E-1 n=1 Tax=Rhizoctonia solani TaxID=456999 RepID=A0A8H2XAL1_9AGAM|nr:unnamed protein product [Rhizoctonia solani]
MIVRDISYDGFKRESRSWLSSVVQNYYPREIDAIYSGILRNVLEDSGLEETGRDDMRRILYLIACTKESLPMDSMSRLLKIDSIDRVKAALRPLRSVLQVTAENGLVSALHPSFPAYILDASRSTKYCCDPKVYGQNMAQHCFRIFRDVQPQFNICGLPSSYIPDNKVHGIEERVYNAIPNDLFYAAQHWAVHVKHANRSLVALEELEDFLFNRLLLWMEVMKLKKCARAMPDIIDLIKDRSGLGNTLYSMELRALIHDAWLFTTAFAFGAVSDSTPHIYISMLLFWPNSNPISKYYARRIKKTMRISGTAIAQRQYTLLATWCFDSITQTPIYSPDGSQIAIAVGEKVLLIMMRFYASSSPPTAPTSSQVRMTDLFDVNSVAFSPNGAHIVSGSRDDNVYIWDYSNGGCIRGPLTGRHGPIIEDAESCQVLNALLPSTSDISFRSMDTSADGAHIATGLTDDTICIWRLEQGQWSPAVLGLPSGKYTCPTHNPFSSVSFSPCGSHLISSSSDGNLHLWDIQTKKLVLGPLHGHTDFITSVSFSPNSVYVISSSHDKTIRVWDIRVRQLEPDPLEGLTGSVTSVEFSPDGTEIFSGSVDQTVRIWDVKKGQLVRGPFKNPHGDNLLIAYSRDRTLIICSSRNGFTLLDAQTGDIAFGPFHSNQTIQSAVSSPDGAYIILALVRNTIRVLKADTGEIIMDILASTGDRCDWLTSAVPSPDGTCIAAGSIRSSFSIYDSQSGGLLRGPYLGHNNGARSLAFSPDSTHIVNGSFSTISVQDAKGGELVLGPLEGHKGWVQVVGYSPDGTQIVSGARDHTICVWDAQTGRLTIGPVKWHTAPVRSVGFSPDGRYIASGSDDGTMRVTDISKEWKCILRSKKGWLRLDFADARIGESWTESYRTK